MAQRLTVIPGPVADSLPVPCRELGERNAQPWNRRREEEDMVASTSSFSAALAGDHSSAPLNSLNVPSVPSSHLDPDLSAMLQRDLLELDLFVSSQVKRTRKEIEQRRRKRLAGVLRAAEDGAERMVRAKDEEIAAAARRSSALVDRLRALAAEGQMWKKLARSSAASVVELRRELEQARQLVCGGEAEDSTSWCGGERSEKGEGMRRCGGCRRWEASRLVLPCRHLSLCGDCDRRTASCPVCEGQKSASIKVFYQ